MTRLQFPKLMAKMGGNWDSCCTTMWVEMGTVGVIVPSIVDSNDDGDVMTPGALFDKLSVLADRVVVDERWQAQKDDLSVSVFGMLLYGYGLGIGRLIMLLDIEDINTAVTRCLVERVGVAPKWGSGLVEDAAKSAFDQAYHSGQHELIGVGHQYMSEGKVGLLVDNVFANIESVRRRAEE